jgi:hypothetical protein
METNYEKIYSGNFIVVQLLVSRLEDAGINPIMKDESQIGLSAVLVSDYQGMIDLYVNQSELDKANTIVSTTLSEMAAE